MVILSARTDRDYQHMRARQGLVYTLAGLIAYAVNNPRKMPDFDKVFPDPKRRAHRQTADEMLQAMRAYSELLETAMRK